MRRLFAPLFALLLLAGSAGAHPFLQDAMWVQFEPERVRLAVNVSLKELQVAQGVSAAADGSFDEVGLAEAAEKHRAYLTAHLRLHAGGQDLAGEVKKVTLASRITTPEATFYQYEIDYPLAGPPPGKISFTHDMLREFPYAIGTAWDVSYVLRMKRSDSDDVTTGLLRYQQPADFPTGWEPASAQDLKPESAGGWRTFRDYLWHGVMHILTGYDHLLFVSALVLATLGFWEMVKVIAAFTLAHTLTLTLSVFAIFRLPPWIVEPVIALSIVFVALENVLFPRRARSWVRLGVAFGFGLIHGLGFAGGLLDAMEGLPAIGIWIALAAFSVGVEIGHQLVVMPLFGALALGRSNLQEGFARPVVRYGSVLISVAGAYYLVVSVHEQFFAH